MHIKLVFFVPLSDIGGCYSNPCLGGAACIPDFEISYICECHEGLQGKNCDNVIFQGLSYQVIAETKNWTDARDECEKTGMTLTSITSQDVLDLLQPYFL